MVPTTLTPLPIRIARILFVAATPVPRIPPIATTAVLPVTKPATRAPANRVSPAHQMQRALPNVLIIPA